MRNHAAVLTVAFAFLFAVPVRAADPVDVEVILPLTGPAAFLGASEQKAIEVAQTVINAGGGIRGVPVRFMYRDDTSSPQVTLQLATAIAERHAPIFFASILANCLATQPVVQKAGPVEYCLANGIHPAPNAFTFAAGPSNYDIALVMVRYLRERGLNRVAILTATDATGQEIDLGLDAAFGRPDNKALQVVAHEHFSPADIEISAQMARIRAAKPQVLITYSLGTPFATVLRGFRDSGLEIPMFASSANMLYSQMAQLKSYLPKEMLFVGYHASAHGATRPGPIRDAQTVFYRAFAAAGLRTEIASITTWDPLFITIDALRALGPTASAEQVRNYIANLHGWAGINAIYDFRGGNQRGISGSALVVDRWDPAKDDWIAVSQGGGGLLTAR